MKSSIKFDLNEGDVLDAIDAFVRDMSPVVLTDDCLVIALRVINGRYSARVEVGKKK